MLPEPDKQSQLNSDCHLVILYRVADSDSDSDELIGEQFYQGQPESAVAWFQNSECLDDFPPIETEAYEGTLNLVNDVRTWHGLRELQAASA